MRGVEISAKQWEYAVLYTEFLMVRDDGEVGGVRMFRRDQQAPKNGLPFDLRTQECPRFGNVLANSSSSISGDRMNV